MDWMLAWGLVLAVAFLLALMRFNNIPKLTNREAIWIPCGMVAGVVFWIAAVTLRYRYASVQPNPLMATTVIGGILGWIAAKVFYAARK
jgi:hypothetical protein